MIKDVWRVICTCPDEGKLELEGSYCDECEEAHVSEKKCTLDPKFSSMQHQPDEDGICDRCSYKGRTYLLREIEMLRRMNLLVVVDLREKLDDIEIRLSSNDGLEVEIYDAMEEEGWTPE